jgi:hypothetical protein
MAKPTTITTKPTLLLWLLPALLCTLTPVWSQRVFPVTNYALDGEAESIMTGGTWATTLVEEMERIGQERRRMEEAGAPQAPAVRTVAVSGVIDTVFVNEAGDIVVTKQDGSQQTVPRPKSAQPGGKPETVVVEDSAGNRYRVESDEATGQPKVTKDVGGGGTPSDNSPIIASNATPNERRLVAEMLGRFANQIAAVLAPAREPVLPRGSGPMAELFDESVLPACLPADQDQLTVIKEYLSKAGKDEKTLDAFINAVFKNDTDKQTIASIAGKTALSDNQKFENVLSSDDLRKVEQTLCPTVVEEAKNYGGRLWWNAPYWERAAKILKEHFEDIGLYENVSVEYGASSCKTIGIIKLAEGVTTTVEVTFSSAISPDDTWDILTKHGVDFWEGSTVTLTSFIERFWNYLAKKDDNLYRGKGWESAALHIFADMLMAPYGAVKGWITGTHWRTRQDLTFWDHALGIVDVVPAEAFTRAAITALIIRVGGQFIDVAKLTQPVRAFLLAARGAGLKLLIKSKDEIILFTADGKQQIGRLLNGVLQDLTWLPGGKTVIAKLAGIKYLDESKRLREGSLEIIEQQGKTGVRAVGEVVGNASMLTGRIKVIYDDLIEAGFKASDEGAEILLRNTDNTLVAKISDDALHVRIPYDNGWAKQSNSTIAINTLETVSKERKVYRLGSLNKSQAGEAQFWSPENPYSYKSIWDYADKYGIPHENLLGDNVFFEVGKIPKGTPFITREAPSLGASKGGSIEVVVPEKSIKLESFSTVKFEK